MLLPRNIQPIRKHFSHSWKCHQLFYVINEPIYGFCRPQKYLVRMFFINLLFRIFFNKVHVIEKNCKCCPNGVFYTFSEDEHYFSVCFKLLRIFIKHFFLLRVFHFFSFSLFFILLYVFLLFFLLFL